MGGTWSDSSLLGLVSLQSQEDDYFLLAKYYLQILAGVTNEDIVLDPEGFLKPGDCHRIPFRLSEADISSDIILLTPLPEAICFSLETPDGDLITPAATAGLPTTHYVSGQNASFYRTSLPVPIGAGAAAGQWHAILEIDDRRFKRYLGDLQRCLPFPPASDRGHSSSASFQPRADADRRRLA